MPTDAVWIMVTVPQKAFEQTLITLGTKITVTDEDQKLVHHEDKTTNLLETGHQTIKSESFMENILQDALDHLQIYDAVWSASKSGQYYHVYFATELESNDYVIQYLRSHGIGSNHNSTLGYIPFEMFFYDDHGLDDVDVNAVDGINYSAVNEKYFDELRDNFLKSITSRLTVAQVVAGLKSGAETSFDFYMYLLFSCTIAAMGIMNTSPIDVAAAMLIEPLMGSVMAISFGYAILSRDLVWTGTKSLTIGMLFCFAFGYVYGIIFEIWRVAWSPPPDGTWPTSEMQIRGETRSLIYGAFIALAGGAVLSVILLRNNIVAMAGVGVATTFMPPFVNGGLLLALATHLQIAGNDEPYEMYNGSTRFAGTLLKRSWMPPRDYDTQYYLDMRWECVALAAVSFAYTIVNVICLLASSYVLLKAKEIAPSIRRRAATASERKFFAEDIKIYRAYQAKYQASRRSIFPASSRSASNGELCGNANNAAEATTTTDSDSDINDIGGQILREWSDITGTGPDACLWADNAAGRAARVQTLRDIVVDVEADPDYQRITRSALGNRYQPPLQHRLMRKFADDAEIRSYSPSPTINSGGDIFTFRSPNISFEKRPTMPHLQQLKLLPVPSSPRSPGRFSATGVSALNGARSRQKRSHSAMPAAPCLSAWPSRFSPTYRSGSRGSNTPSMHLEPPPFGSTFFPE